jgi:hypothetical protein
MTINTVEKKLKDLEKILDLELFLDKTSPKDKRKGKFITVKYGATGCIASIQFTKSGKFSHAFCIEPGRYRDCIEEQLTHDQAIDEAVREVYDMEDVEKFFKRKPYKWFGKEKWLKSIEKYNATFDKNIR